MSRSEAPKRRRFTAEYKQSILDRLDACSERGERSRVLQVEDLLWSHVAKWRRQRDAGMLDDSWTELSTRSRLDLLLQEREELLAEIEGLQEQNERLQEQAQSSPHRGPLREALARLIRSQPAEDGKTEDRS
jgi:hypothetical protein